MGSAAWFAGGAKKTLAKRRAMEDAVDAASLEVVCAVWVVRHGVDAERLESGVAIPAGVAAAVEEVRRWAAEEVPVEAAAWEGSVEGVQFCLGELRAGNRVYAKKLALARSASGGRLEVVRWLVEDGPVAQRLLDSMALARAASRGHLAVVRFLVEEGGVDVHAYEDVALVASAAHGHLAVVRWLVEEGGADIHARNDAALELSVGYFHYEVGWWLVNVGGADIASMNLDGVDQWAFFAYLRLRLWRARWRVFVLLGLGWCGVCYWTAAAL